MEIAENTQLEESLKPVYSQKDFDEYKEKLEDDFQKKEALIKEEAKKENQKENMSELELAKAELEDMKKKYQQKEDECTISRQKEETLVCLKDAELDKKALELVYVPLDMDSTKKNIEILKELMVDLRKDIFKNTINAPVLEASDNTTYDPFIEGFDTNRL